MTTFDDFSVLPPNCKAGTGATIDLPLTVVEKTTATFARDVSGDDLPGLGWRIKAELMHLITEVHCNLLNSTHALPKALHSTN